MAAWAGGSIVRLISVQVHNTQLIATRLRSDITACAWNDLHVRFDFAVLFWLLPVFWDPAHLTGSKERDFWTTDCVKTQNLFLVCTSVR